MQIPDQLNALKISFIGGGNMARALINGLVDQGVQPGQINVIESDADKRAKLKHHFGVSVTEQLPSVSNSDIIVLAVKPQQLRDVSIFLGSLIKRQLLISIAAGVRIRDLSRWLGGYQAIVRVMPNTPAQILRGVSALYAAPSVSEIQRQQARSMMSAVGHTLWLENEESMDAVTAISGSGPAYVFYLIEAMQDAAIALGFDKEQARILSLLTFAGASQLALQSEEPVAELRRQVTSKGGTTEHAIESMEAAGIKRILTEAAQAAAYRSKELGDVLGSD